MENKILTQELNLIEELLHLVNTEEEYDGLVARAKEICWFWQPPSQRSTELSSRGLEMIALIDKGIVEKQRCNSQKSESEIASLVFSGFHSNYVKGGDA